MKINEVINLPKLPDPSRSPIVGRADQKPITPHRDTRKAALNKLDKIKK